MCQPASFVATKDKVFWSENGDSHELIIEENNLREMNVRDEPLFVRVEVVPENKDYRKPLDEWNYRLDQDMKPEWYDAEDVERRCRAELPKWLAANVVLPGQEVEEINKPMVAVYGTVQKVWDGGTVRKVRDGGTVQKVWDGGTVQEVRDGGTVQKVWDGGTVQEVWGGGTVQKVWDGGTVQKVWGGGTVQEVWGGGTVQKVWDGGTVIAYTALNQDILKTSKAVLIDRSKDTVQCFVGKDEK